MYWFVLSIDWIKSYVAYAWWQRPRLWCYKHVAYFIKPPHKVATLQPSSRFQSRSKTHDSALRFLELNDVVLLVYLQVRENVSWVVLKRLKTFVVAFFQWFGKLTPISSRVYINFFIGFGGLFDNFYFWLFDWTSRTQILWFCWTLLLRCACFWWSRDRSTIRTRMFSIWTWFRGLLAKSYSLLVCCDCWLLLIIILVRVLFFL